VPHAAFGVRRIDAKDTGEEHRWICTGMRVHTVGRHLSRLPHSHFCTSFEINIVKSKLNNHESTITMKTFFLPLLLSLSSLANAVELRGSVERELEPKNRFN
jgi:hypothetical protein